MAGVSISDFGASFIKYLPGVTETLNSEVLGRRLAMKNTQKWEGEHIEFKVHVQRNSALGYTTDGGAIPVAKKQNYVTAKAFRRFLTGSVQITDGALANAATTKNAAIDVVDSELRNMMEGIAKFENFMFYRNGTGVVGLVGTDITGTTWGATDGRLLAQFTGNEYEVRDAAAIGTLHGTVNVSSVARAPDANGHAAVTSVAALPAAAAATDFIVWPGATNIAITGLDSMVDDASTTFQNIATSTYPRYTSPVLDNSGTARALTPTLFRQMLAMIAQESGKPAKKGLKVLTNNWQAIEVEELYESELRLTPTSKVGGLDMASFQTSFGRVDIVPDVDAPYNKMFFVDFSQIYRAVQAELHWRKNQGGGIFRVSDSSTVRHANALEICEYYIKQRHTSGKIEDLSETHKSAY